MADDRVEVTFGADFSELVAAAQQVKEQLTSLATSVHGAGEDFEAAGQVMQSSATVGAQAWSGTLTIIGTSIDAVLKAVLTGTQTWQQAMARVFSDLALSFAEKVADMIVSWMAFEALGLGSGMAGGGTLAAVGGLLGLGGASSGAVSSAGELGALAMFQAGAWSVPRDMVALVHAGEMILPAGVADMARSGQGVSGFPSAATAAPGGSNLTLNVSVQAIDAGSVAQWANANAKTLASTITRYMGNNPSARSD